MKNYLTVAILALLKMLIPMLCIAIIAFITTCVWYYPKYKKTKKGLIPFLMDLLLK